MFLYYTQFNFQVRKTSIDRLKINNRMEGILSIIPFFLGQTNPSVTVLVNQKFIPGFIKFFPGSEYCYQVATNFHQDLLKGKHV